MSSYSSMTTARDGDAYVTTRETREAAIRVAVDFGVGDPARDGDLKTGIAFFDHMLEMLGWWADFTISASYQHRTSRCTTSSPRTSAWRSAPPSRP